MYKFIVMRHGESLLNKSNQFGGWLDVDLTQKGTQEAIQAANVIQQFNFQIDVVHTSALRRSIKTANIMLETMNQLWVPIYHTKRLNERHYGILQGFNKKEAAHKYGEQQLKLWRRSFSQSPPPLEINGEKYTESLLNVSERVRPYWEDVISNQIHQRKNVLVVGHSNSLRALLYIIKKLNEKQLLELNIPTAIPLVINLDHKLRYVSEQYLGDQDLIKEKIKSVANQGIINNQNN